MQDFLFVPPAPSSTIIKSLVVKSAPISVPPSISNDARVTLPAVLIVANISLETVPVSPVPIKVPDATGKTTTALLLAECGCVVMFVRVRLNFHNKI